MNLNEMLKQLKKGEKVICKLCNRGILKPVGNEDSENAKGFICDHCGEMLIID